MQKKELQKQRAELEEHEKWAAIEDEILGKRERMKNEIHGKIQKEEMKKKITVKTVQMQIQRAFTDKDRANLKPYKDAAERIFRATGIHNTEVLVDAFLNLGPRKKLAQTNLEEVREARIERTKELEELKVWGFFLFFRKSCEKKNGIISSVWRSFSHEKKFASLTVIRTHSHLS